ncbi:hypothetical protein WMY93_026333 [Mugilogobius chulae]|uniref:Uncharacterized protein n=1 Tax=Mugilogobius chulae TaxID=88201 RepID=A0AAW0MX51_9GOBI
MPVVGVASKLRQPTTRPVHTALPIPSAVRMAQGYSTGRQPNQELRTGQGSTTTPPLTTFSYQLAVKTELKPDRSAANASVVSAEGKSKGETEESKICKVSAARTRLQVDGVGERGQVLDSYDRNGVIQKRREDGPHSNSVVTHALLQKVISQLPGDLPFE